MNTPNYSWIERIIFRPANEKLKRVRTGAMLAYASLAMASGLSAATLTIDGTHLEQQNIEGYLNYKAPDGTVYVQQGKPNEYGYGYNSYGFNVKSSPSGAEFRKGTIVGHGDNHTMGWDELYGQSNGAGVLLKNSQNATVTRVYTEYVWDGIRVSTGCTGTEFIITKNWLTNSRDDAIEAENAITGGLELMTISNNLIEGSFVFLSTRDTSICERASHTVHVKDNVLSLGLLPMDDAKFEEDWTGTVPMNVSGQFFKTVENGQGMTLLFKNNTVLLEALPATKEAHVNILPENATIDAGSTGNLFVWLGGTPPTFTATDMETIDGVSVPKILDVDPAVWDVSDDIQDWIDAREAWIDDVWYSGSPPSPIPADPAVPYLELLSPTDGTTVGGEVTITAGAFDNDEVDGVQFKINGTNLGSEDTTAPYTITWDTSGYSDGTHDISAVATDAEGNTTTGEVEVTVDNNGSSSVYEFFPIADTHIREAVASSNYGSRDTLRVLDKTSYDSYAVLEFDLTGISGTVTDVRLRLRSSASEISNTSVHKVSGSWSESVLTWTNSSLSWNGELDTVSDIEDNAWYEFDLGTSYFDGNVNKSIGLKSNASSPTEQEWMTRESDFSPVLIVEVSNGGGGSSPSAVTNTAPANVATDVKITPDLTWSAAAGANFYGVYIGTSVSLGSGDFVGYFRDTWFDAGTLASGKLDPGTTYYWRVDSMNNFGVTTGTVWSFTTDSTPGQTLSFTSIQDTHIRENQATGSYGHQDTMQVRTSSGADRYSVIDFDVTGIGSGQVVTHVSLSLYLNNDPIPDTSIYEVTGSWVETGTGSLTWSNSTLTWGSTAIGTVSDAECNLYHNIELDTDFIDNGDGTYTVGLKSTGSATLLEWRTRESSRPPILIIELNDG